jgi:hypothetical protein
MLICPTCVSESAIAPWKILSAEVHVGVGREYPSSAERRKNGRRRRSIGGRVGPLLLPLRLCQGPVHQIAGAQDLTGVRDPSATLNVENEAGAPRTAFDAR